MASQESNSTSFKPGDRPWNDGIRGYRNFKNSENRIDRNNPLFLDSLRPGYHHCGVYAIIHKTSRRIYIGSSVGMGRRLLRHRNNFAKKRDVENRLISAFLKEPEQFEFSVIEETRDENEARDREQFWINFYQSYREDIGYNCSKSSTSCRGVKPSKETLQKISAALTGRKRGPVSEETKLKISAANTGRRATPEEIEKAVRTRRERKSKWEKVHKIAPDGEVIETFDSITLAAQAHNSSSGANIGAVISGRRPLAFGFKWRKA